MCFNFRALVASGSAVYSPVQPSSNEEVGTATLYVSEPASHQITSIVEETKPSFYLPRSSIVIESTMMEGTFGSIFHANLLLPGLSVKEVVVKTVKSNIR